MKKKLFLFLPAAVGVVLAFVSGPSGPDTAGMRLFNLSWNIGHIFACCLWTYLLISYYRPIARQPYGYQLVWVAIIALILSIIIEVIQAKYLGRTGDIQDILKNMVGVALALSFLSPARKASSRLALFSFQTITISALIYSFTPMAIALTDEWIAKRQFPILGTFEAPFEITRWETINSTIAIDRHFKSQGKASMRIDLEPKRYSGAFLHYFPQDWRNYSSISFMVLNPDADIFNLTCSIKDLQHIKNGYQYHDRFNRRIEIKPGWNQIEIPLKEIERAPATRRMNMSEIEGVTFYVTQPDQPHAIYLDDLRLNK